MSLFEKKKRPAKDGPAEEAQHARKPNEPKQIKAYDKYAN